MYKISRYNHFQERPDGKYIAYNARSGAVAIMDPDNYAAYENLARKIESAADSPFSPAEAELLKQLEYASFVYLDDYDELEELAFCHYSARYDATSLGFVLAPTMACNMACSYCYEGNKKGRMSDETMESIVDFVRRRGGHLRDLSVGWYGGEPLLAMDIIERLSERLIRLGQEQSFKYEASIITNGFLLTGETVDRLLDFGVDSIQLTLDGPARVHNGKRPLKNGRPSYERILENMAYASGKMKIGVRVNVDRSFNGEIITEMLRELDAAGLKNYLGIYFGWLEPSTTVCANIAESCLSATDFSKVEIEYFRLLLEEGFRIGKLPTPVLNFCVAQSSGGFVMDHEGNLYRCFNHVGDHDRSMGNIRDQLNYNHPNFTRLFRFDAFQDDLCRSCDILPICMGGCPSRRQDRGVTGGDMCESWRHNLPDMLEIIAQAKLQEMKSAVKEQS
ncbi:MAG: radical SAM protein [Candidatus Zixiibacteriota bacterium]|nr:MAG: radical SAM protein [candidate division Zixibacteria bacterium]